MTTVPAVTTRRVTVTGVVQGVGFRPFVHRLAVRHGLAGWVRNVGGEVEITVAGDAGEVEGFLRALRAEAPPLARVETVVVTLSEPVPIEGFTVEPSLDPPGRRQPVSPDAALCAACEAELLDPANRRHRYPFITCTDCGPRFTVIEAMPYDRERTSMRRFTMCPACAAEYATPGNRRHRSETNSCPGCGPRLWFVATDGHQVEGASDDVIAAAASLLHEGGIVALRGFGGFHLAVDATNDAAVARLRARKHRDAKPFAVMVRSLQESRTIGGVNEQEATLLTSSVRPVVLLRRRPGSSIAPSVAPGLDTIGVLLPATPLHHLLLAAVKRPLVMTSGNASGDPIAIGNVEALERLGGIADGFLLHDREIVSRYDDSVLRIVSGEQILLRRARGIAPLPIPLPVSSPAPFLAVGADLKNTFTLVHGDRAYVSQHIGDLECYETTTHFAEALRRYTGLFEIAPRLVVHDLHPGYHSTRLAADTGLPPLAVQHHHAHVAAVLAEHGEQGPAIGISCDGTGYGDDGQVWGAEILHADLLDYRRLAHLRYAPLPGGDLAARQPWRTALGWLSLDRSLADDFALAFEGIAPLERSVAETQIRQQLNTPLASSMGRLFDAAAAVLGVRRVNEYEGQAAMELESLAGDVPGHAIPVQRHDPGEGPAVIDPLPLLATLGRERQQGVSVEQLAADFHESVATFLADEAAAAVSATGCTTIVLGGGVFQNAQLAERVPVLLQDRRVRVLLPRLLSPNDGSISFGQAAIAAARLSAQLEEVP